MVRVRQFFTAVSSDMAIALLFCGVFASAMLGFALVMQYVVGLHPCQLCLYQRWPWAVVAVAGAGVFLWRKLSKVVLLLGCVACLALIAGASIALYHHGVEQHWWQNAIECSTALPDMRDLAAFKAALLARPVVACDAIPWQFLKLSMAAWNFILSLLLAALVAGHVLPRFIRRKRS